MYYVYILKSIRDKKLYIGFSADLKQRVAEHKQGKVFSTKNRLPVELVYYESYKSKEDALEREQGLKKSGSVYNGLIKRIKKSIEK